MNNDEDVVLVAGTVSKPIPISLDYPAGLNITLVPSVASGIELIPYTIDLFVGDILYNLYISASSNIAAEDYYINWTTNNDLDDPYYTPISTTKVLVYNNIDETVSLGEIPAIPLGGTSLPI